MTMWFLLYFGQVALSPDSGSLEGFPCDLKQLTFTPEIILVGETHEHERCMKEKQDLLSGASQGQYFFAMEGLLFDKNSQNVVCGFPTHLAKPESLVYGVENSSVYTLSALLSINGVLIDESREEFLHLIRASQVFREAWTQFRHLVKDEAEVSGTAFSLLDEYMRDPQKITEELIDQVEQRRNHPWDNEDTWDAITEKALRVFAAYVKAQKFSKSTQLPKGFDKIVNRYASFPVPVQGSGTDLFPIIIHWRNQFLARNIAALYCEAARAKKNLHVLVGSGHVPELFGILSRWSAGHIPISVKNSKGVFASARLKLKTSLEALRQRMPKDSFRIDLESPSECQPTDGLFSP